MPSCAPGVRSARKFVPEKQYHFELQLIEQVVKYERYD
jgi:hypothetical protein